MSYSVGIVTYVKRFEKHFIPLLTSIKQQRPDLEIIACVNGEHNQVFDQQYRFEILTFIASHQNVYPMVCTQFRALAKLWNNCVWNSSNNQTLILNDDVSISPDFWPIFDKKCEDGNLTFKINNSHSHFSVNRYELDDIGWFDERFLGVGEEDGDFQRRWEICFGRQFETVDIAGISNLREQDECLGNIRKIDHKYSLFNRELMRRKFDFGVFPPSLVQPNVNQCPSERFFWENRGSL